MQTCFSLVVYCRHFCPNLISTSTLIEFKRHTLANGLRVLVHEDTSTPMVAVNLLYNVGSRDESPDSTGFAHLFEHLMFGGSENAPDFDTPIQMAGGENNAFTNNDITNFYELLPAENVEVALWLESDRMNRLLISEEVLDVQRRVVVEEFKETCLNQPYGDIWHHLSDLAYKAHPYRWPTIGKVPQHIEQAQLSEVNAFYERFYRPNNAILVLAGNLAPERGISLAEKWFGDIQAGPQLLIDRPSEPPQRQYQYRSLDAKVPNDAIYLAFHMPARTDPHFYTVDLLSDILANGRSARLYRKLLKEKQLFDQIDCYVSGYIDPGLFIIEGKPSSGVSVERAREAIWHELRLLQEEPIPETELQKVKNKVESTLLFSEMNVLTKAINLAFFELIGDPELINREVELYRAITAAEMQQQAIQLFQDHNCSELTYLAQREVAAA